jgi:hypothetical protein
MYLLLFFICFGPFDPFYHILVTTGVVIVLCYFVRSWLVVEFR